MSLARIVLTGLATTMLSSTAFANGDDCYRCNDHYCYDDQADETRELNLRQLENPGAGMDAVPPPGYSNDGQGGPYDEAPDQDDDYAPQADNPSEYDDPDADDAYDEGPPPDDDE